ncbi:hypothetical protein HDU78_003737 [Chytriomyces hyalinus]|nr:hypothetical protein HDU78_003737 [Chytriomyces hyalinus]
MDNEMDVPDQDENQAPSFPQCHDTAVSDKSPKAPPNFSTPLKKSRKTHLPPELIHQIVETSAYLCPVCSRAHLEPCSTSACLSLCPSEACASLRCKKCDMVYCEACAEMDAVAFCDLCDQSYCAANGSKPGCGDIASCECKCVEACIPCVFESGA